MQDYYPQTRGHLTAALILVAALVVFCGTAHAELRTYDMLTKEELAELNRLEDVYFKGVRDEALTLLSSSFDAHTILHSFTPQVRIVRQRKRDSLNSVTRYLCHLRLEQEFITNYIRILREDALDFAMDGLLKKSRRLKGGY